MNTREEIVDVFDGHPGDCPPPALFTQTGTVGQMDACGASWPAANFDADGMVELALQPSRMFGFATARVPFCITVEAEGLGAVLNEGRRDIQPSVVGSPFVTDGGILPPDGLPSPDEFVSGGRRALVAEAAGRISGSEDLFVTTCMLDPFGVVDRVLGAENVLMASIMQPDVLAGWVDAVAPLALAYARRLSEVSDNVMIIASASSDLMSPDTYAGLSEPYLREAVSAVSAFSTIHCCGTVSDNLESLVSMGADGLSLAASPDPEGFLRAIDRRCLMFGAVDPIGTLLMGSPGDVVAQASLDAGLGFDIVTPDCGVPPGTPNENLMALSGYRERVRSGPARSRERYASRTRSVGAPLSRSGDAMSRERRWWARPDLNRRPSGYEPDALPA